MCYLKDYDDCYSDVLRFKRVLEIEDFVFTKEYIQEIIFKRLVEKISKNKVTSVRVRETLTPEDETTVLTWGIT
jgi:hypothetical protein